MPYCAHCKNVCFTTQEMLQRHIEYSRSHPSCESCNLKFEDTSAFETHLKSKHSGCGRSDVRGNHKVALAYRKGNGTTGLLAKRASGHHRVVSKDERLRVVAASQHSRGATLQVEVSDSETDQMVPGSFPNDACGSSTRSQKMTPASSPTYSLSGCEPPVEGVHARAEISGGHCENVQRDAPSRFPGPSRLPADKHSSLGTSENDTPPHCSLALHPVDDDPNSIACQIPEGQDVGSDAYANDAQSAGQNKGKRRADLELNDDGIIIHASNSADRRANEMMREAEAEIPGGGEVSQDDDTVQNWSGEGKEGDVNFDGNDSVYSLTSSEYSHSDTSADMPTEVSWILYPEDVANTSYIGDTHDDRQASIAGTVEENNGDATSGAEGEAQNGPTNQESPDDMEPDHGASENDPNTDVSENTRFRHRKGGPTEQDIKSTKEESTRDDNLCSDGSSSSDSDGDDNPTSVAAKGPPPLLDLVIPDSGSWRSSVLTAVESAVSPSVLLSPTVPTHSSHFERTYADRGAESTFEETLITSSSHNGCPPLSTDVNHLMGLETLDDVDEEDIDAMSSSANCPISSTSGRADEDLRPNVAGDISTCQTEEWPSETSHSTNTKLNDISLQFELPGPLITTDWIDSTESGQGLHIRAKSSERTRHPAHLMTVGTEGVQDVRVKDDRAVSLAGDKDGDGSGDEDEDCRQQTGGEAALPSSATPGKSRDNCPQLERQDPSLATEGLDGVGLAYTCWWASNTDADSSQIAAPPITRTTVWAGDVTNIAPSNRGDASTSVIHPWSPSVMISRSISHRSRVMSSKNRHDGEDVGEETANEETSKLKPPELPPCFSISYDVYVEPCLPGTLGNIHDEQFARPDH